MAYHLLIKGTVNDASTALIERGFNPKDWLTSPTLLDTGKGSKHVVTEVTVKDECEAGVVRWFAETCEPPPFPMGTLLHYYKKGSSS